MRAYPIMETEFSAPEANKPDIDLRRICGATLHSAIFDYFDIGAFMRSESEMASDKEIERIRWRAQFWLFNDEDYEFSFVWCCQVLDLNPDFIREAITLDAESILANCRKNLPAY